MVIRGAQKQMIVIRTGDSRYFDEAYFVLRNKVRTGKDAEREMIREANRILRESEPDASLPPKRCAKAFILFLTGILCGGLVAAAICLAIL